MIVGILQPSYLPWIGFLEQIARTDVFVLYDDVQFEKGSWRNRNRIKTPNGIAWLSVPVLTKGLGFPLIRDIRINNSTKWCKKHIRTIEQNYSKAEYFAQYAPAIFAILDRQWEKLVDLNNELLSHFLTVLGLEKKIVSSSELGIEGKSSERLVAIIKELGGTAFYEGSAGRNYIDMALFNEAGIDLIFQDYEHPVYPQLHGEFIPYLSIIDLLFNCGPNSHDILMLHGETQ